MKYSGPKTSKQKSSGKRLTGPGTTVKASQLIKTQFLFTASLQNLLSIGCHEMKVIMIVFLTRITIREARGSMVTPLQPMRLVNGNTPVFTAFNIQLRGRWFTRLTHRDRKSTRLNSSHVA